MKRNESNIDLELLLHKYVTNQASEDEVRIAEEMFEHQSETKAEMEALNNLWNMSEDVIPTKSFDADKAFAKFKQEIGSEQTHQAKEISLHPKKEATVRPINFRRILAIASMFIGLFIVGTLVFNSDPSYETGDQLMAVNLDDGSLIKVAPHSELKVTGDRSVSFEGNGYFDIHHDAARPFTVSLDDSEVQVLGTSFVIEQKGDDKIVSLEEGKVVVNKNGQTVSLVPGEYATISKSGLSKSTVTSVNAYSIKNGFLVFDKTPLSQVIEDFERHYNVDLTIDNKSELDYCTLNAPKISTNDATEAANIIASIFEADVSSTGKSFMISGLDCQ